MDEKHKPKDRRAAFRRLVDYLKPYRGSVALGVLSNLWIGLAALIPPLVYGKLMTDRVILNRLNETDGARLRLLVICVIAQMAVYGSSSFMLWVRSLTMHVLGERIILDLRKQIYGRLQMLSVSYFDSRQTGEIMSRVTNDSEVVEEFINHAADTLISDAIRLTAMCIVMFWVSSRLALIAVIPIPVLFLLAFRFSRKVRPVYRKVRERLAEINAKVQENLSGIRVIKAFAREDYEYESFRGNAEDFYNQRVKAIRMWTSFFPSIDILVRTVSVVVWVAGAYMIIR